jgi:hypothetical protein
MLVEEFYNVWTILVLEVIQNLQSRETEKLATLGTHDTRGRFEETNTTQTY